MTIITLSDALIQRLASTDRRILRDRVVSGFCIRLNKRTRTFFIATTAAGKQVRVTIGRWPLISTDQAREQATKLLLDCRMGIAPMKPVSHELPTIREVLPLYAQAKGLKASSFARYSSILRTHFDAWLDRQISELGSQTFAEHCHRFAKSQGAAIVDVGRGLITAVIKYVNTIHGLSLESPFTKLAAAGLMPERAEPRKRLLQESGLPAWYEAVQRLGEKQRDLLVLLALTGLRRNEGGMLSRREVDLERGLITIDDTKNGVQHSLPITPAMLPILERRLRVSDADKLFPGVALEHLAKMAVRAGAPNFMLHDLRKMLASMGEKEGVGDAMLRRILNHKAKRSDTLHRHYVELTALDILPALTRIQSKIMEKWAVPFA